MQGVATVQVEPLMFADTDVGLRPAGGFVNVIVIDCEADDTNCGLRPLADVLAGTMMTNCGVTRPLSAGFVGAFVGVMTGDIPPPPPPAHAATDAAAIRATAEKKSLLPSRSMSAAILRLHGNRLGGVRDLERREGARLIG